MTHPDLAPRSVSDVLTLARLYAQSSLVTSDDRERAAARLKALGCSLFEALVADMFVRIMAGASRGIDPSTAIGYFSIQDGNVRPVREAPLALVRRSGLLEEMDERVIGMAELAKLENIVRGYHEPEDNADNAELQARWMGLDNNRQKLLALEVRAAERLAQLLVNGREDGAGYSAAVCCVRRAGVWHVKIQDIDHAQARGLLDAGSGSADWWQRWPEEALKYSARQPLLREVFGDVTGGLGPEEVTPAAGPAPASATAEPGTDPDGDLRAGVEEA